MSAFVFTPELAVRAIPLLRSIATDLRAATVELASLRHAPASEARDVRQRALNRVLLECTRELDQIGCVFKGFHEEHALFDFPARLEGRPVFLCWRADESTVGHYHEVDRGFAQRRPLAALGALPG
jgi:hypothetical protein